MRGTRTTRRRSGPAACCLVMAMALVGGCGDGDDGEPAGGASRSAAASGSPSGSPLGLVAIGHSGLTGAASNPENPDVDVSDNSWATGSNPDVESVYRRLVAARPATRGHVANQAVDGAEAATLVDQARVALAQVPAPELVLVQTIDNDIRCDGTDAAHVPEFGADLAAALDLVTTDSPESAVLVVSQLGRPASYLRAVPKDPSAAALLGDGDGMCDLLEPDGRTPATAHVAALTRIIERYEAEQARVCQQFAQCHTDDGLLSTYVDTPAGLASDLQHLSVAGHAEVAELIWPAVAEILELS